MPMEGITYEQMGFDSSRRAQMLKRMQDVGKPLGLEFSGGRSIVPNTIMSHLLTEYAEHHGGIDNQNQVADRLLKGFFGEGAMMDKDFLLQVASDVGLDTQDVAKYITSHNNQREIKKKARSWSEQGISGVPFFFMNGIPTFSGAQDPEVFKSTILKVAEKHPLPLGEKDDKKSSL